jgi:putative ABC transport system permease protein
MRTLGTVTFIQRGGSEERSVVELDQMILMAKDADLVFPAARMIAAILEHLHKKKDYEIVIPLELLQQRETVQRNFTFAMVAIAAISLIVGGIGIANIMLATITERTREIGVRRALGATRGDILMQFLTETAAIGVVGGVLGWPLGLGLTQLISRLFEWPALVAPHYVIVSLAISCVVAVLSGIYPARRAARLDPITALRYE